MNAIVKTKPNYKTALSLIMFVLSLAVSVSCGSEANEIPVTLNVDSNNNPFTNPALDDVIFILSQPSDPTTSVVFPAGCASGGSSSLPAGCGFSPTAESFRLNLELVEQGATVTLTARGRDENGTTLFEGTSDPFTNNSTTTSVSINVAASS